MHEIDPNGFLIHHPDRRKSCETPSRGPHDVWVAEGDDILKEFGLNVLADRNKFWGKWLKMLVFPNNRLVERLAYGWLSLIKEIGGGSITFLTQVDISYYFFNRLAITESDRIRERV